MRLLKGFALHASGFRLYSFTTDFTGANAFVQLLAATLTSKNVAIHDLPLSGYCLDWLYFTLIGVTAGYLNNFVCVLPSGSYKTISRQYRQVP
jgi:hypothetical protein